ncbi:UDP-N-acetylglucosamine 4-epimerase [Commensalibacter sp. Nvir]|uniref:NAD-dependent epimerase/dehydratase family protein n=1 Tax=Commensalibacter sp. Nvir TaxID=3069817 RepID=UPI002D3AA987|nr:UDP-N-acetylglucosamine 4-epimerase [Commensalibacter sp. Nvir]
MVCLITGAAGFIGYHLAHKLLIMGEKVIGIDNINNYYSPNLKKDRCLKLKKFQNFKFYRADILDQHDIKKIFSDHPDISFIFHFAAQAGVRYSLINPSSYIQINIQGHLNILEAAKNLPKIERIFYASSSSVYGSNKKLPFNENDRTELPNSVYAVSKKSAELLSTSYHHLFGLKQTGLRFFTVYGPWGRPDMAYYSFAKAIIENTPITLYTGEDLSRDFTYIDDVIEAILKLQNCETIQDCGIYNIGNNRQEKIAHLITFLEKNLGRKALIHYVQRPETDIESTLADISAIEDLTGWRPVTCLEKGIKVFTDWLKDYKE